MAPDDSRRATATQVAAWTGAALQAVDTAHRGDLFGGAQILESVLAAGRPSTVCAASALTVCAGEKTRTALGPRPPGTLWRARASADGQDPQTWAMRALAAYLNDDADTLGEMFWGLPEARRGERIRALFDLVIFGDARWGERLHATTDV